MTKKQYLSPHTVIIKVMSQHILTSSNISSTNGVDGLGYGGDTSTEGISSGNSRKNNFWDDEY